MHTDARDINDGRVLSCDICIIGGGPSGMTVAKELKDSNKNVILLEGGGIKPKSKRQDLFSGKNLGFKYYPLRSSRIHSLGGSSNHWGGYCTPLDPVDFENYDVLPRPGWPIDFHDLSEAYERASRILRLKSPVWDVEYWKNRRDDSPIIDKGKKIKNKVWQGSGGYNMPVRFGDAYLSELNRSTNVSVIINARVSRLTVSNRGKVRRAVIRNFSGEEKSVDADIFILACGAIQNPRILMYSNRVNEKRIGAGRNLVGNYFMDHISADSAILELRNPSALSFHRRYVSNERDSWDAVWTNLSVSPEYQLSQGVLNSAAHFSLDKVGEDSMVLFDKYPEKVWPHIQAWNQQFLKDNSSSSFTSSLDTADYSIRKNICLHTIAEQVPRKDSRVLLSDESDALGLPRINLRWKVSKEDIRTMKSINYAIKDRLESAGIGEVKLMKWVKKPHKNLPPRMTGGVHHIGTTRMSSDPARGVVDSNCKVFDTKNLYILGSSVFPTGGCANPTLTVVALAVRLANYLQS